MTTSRRLWVALLCGLALALAQPAWGGSTPRQSSSPAEQGAWAPLRDGWDGLPAERQRKLRTGAEAWSQMNDGKRQPARQRLERWKTMTPEERAGLRQRYERFRQLPQEEQEKLRGSFEWFQSLPAERKRVLIEQWRKLAPEQRHKVLPSYVPRRHNAEHSSRPEERGGPGR